MHRHRHRRSSFEPRGECLPRVMEAPSDDDPVSDTPPESDENDTLGNADPSSLLLPAPLPSPLPSAS